MPIRKPIRVQKRSYSTRTAVRVYEIDKPRCTYTVPSIDPKYLRSIPGLVDGVKYEYVKQTRAIISGEVLTSKWTVISPLKTYKQPILNETSRLD